MQKDGYRLFGFYASEIHEPKSEKVSGYLIGIYELPVTALEMNNMIYTFNSYAEIVGNAGDVIVHPFVFTEVAKEKLVAITAKPEFIEPLVETNNWRVQFHIQEEDVLPISKKIWKMQLIVELLWSTSLILLLAVILKAYLGKESVLYTIAGCVVLNFIAINVFIMISFAHSFTSSHENANDFKQIYHKVADLRESTIMVPTDLRVENITLIDNSSYVISGFITQVYPKDHGIEVGIIFPDEIKTGTQIELISTLEQADDTTYVWQFSVELGKLFSQQYFPLDKRHLEIVMWPKDLTGKVFIVPDLMAFSDLRPTDLPGISNSVEINNWEIDQSFFGMSDRTFTYFQKYNLPFSTDFMIVLQRSLLSAFITNLMPLFICTLLTFVLVCMPIKKLESPTLSLVSIFIAIIFVVTMNQTGLRRNLGIHSFAYIEVLYSLYYFQLLLLTLNLIIYTTGSKRFAFISYRDNLLTKLSYWPLLIGAFTMVMIVGFS